jgi:hypothetical protein
MDRPAAALTTTILITLGAATETATGASTLITKNNLSIDIISRTHLPGTVTTTTTAAALTTTILTTLGAATAAGATTLTTTKINNSCKTISKTKIEEYVLDGSPKLII